jgi:hypothetical protein
MRTFSGGIAMSIAALLPLCWSRGAARVTVWSRLSSSLLRAWIPGASQPSSLLRATFSADAPVASARLVRRKRETSRVFIFMECSRWGFTRGLRETGRG